MSTTDNTEKPAISPGLAKIISIALGFTSPLIAKIKNDYARVQLDRFVTPLKQVILALSDADHNDGAQIQAILHNFFTNTGFSTDTKVQILQILNDPEKIKDQRLAKVLVFLVSFVFDIIPMLIDEQVPNDAQILAYAEDKLRSDEGVAFIQSLLEFVIKDEEIAALIASIVAEIIKGAIDNPKLIQSLK